MTAPDPASRFDWNLYWQDHGPSKEMGAGGRRMARRVERFVRVKGLHVPSLADIGCGPAVTIFELAKRHPGWRFVGYDASPTVLLANRARALRQGHTNVRFAVVKLPSVPRGQFDLVLCVATLHYLAAAPAALRRLFGLVRPGGYLVFNYPNRATRAWYARAAREAPGLRARFEVLLAGASVLSRREAQNALGVPLEDFWTAVGERPVQHNPCLAARKPEILRKASPSSSARSSR